MSYARDLGLDWSKVGVAASKYLSTAATVAEVAPKIAADPYLGEVICEVDRLSNVEAGLPAGPKCPRTQASPAQVAKGIGLKSAVFPLRLYILHKQYPFVLPVALAGLLGLVYAAGKASR